MLSTDEFKAWAKDVVLFCHVTTRIEGRKDEDLLGKKGGTGFPYLVALDAEGNVAATLKGGRTVEGFTAMIAAAKEYSARKTRADLPVSEVVDLLCFDYSVRNIDLDAFKAATGALEDLSEADRAKVDGVFLGVEVEKILKETNGRDPASRQASGKVFADFMAAGRVLDEGHRLFDNFYIFILEHAEAGKDVDLFEKALAPLKEKHADNPRAAKFFEQKEAVLKGMREGTEKPEEE